MCNYWYLAAVHFGWSHQSCSAHCVSELSGPDWATSCLFARSNCVAALFESLKETLWTSFSKKEWMERRKEWKLTLLWYILCEGKRDREGKEESGPMKEKETTKGPLRLCVRVCVNVRRNRGKDRGGSCRQGQSYLYKSTDLVFSTLTLL